MYMYIRIVLAEMSINHPSHPINKNVARGRHVKKILALPVQLNYMFAGTYETERSLAQVLHAFSVFSFSLSSLTLQYSPRSFRVFTW